jgi:hypothetical protein
LAVAIEELVIEELRYGTFIRRTFHQKNLSSEEPIIGRAHHQKSPSSEEPQTARAAVFATLRRKNVLADGTTPVAPAPAPPNLGGEPSTGNGS